MLMAESPTTSASERRRSCELRLPEARHLLAGIELGGEAVTRPVLGHPFREVARAVEIGREVLRLADDDPRAVRVAFEDREPKRRHERMFAYLPPMRRCLVCGGSLTGRRSDCPTCSPSCRRQASRVRAVLSGRSDGPYSALDQLEKRSRRRAKVAQTQ